MQLDVWRIGAGRCLVTPALWFSLCGGLAAYLCAVYWLGTPPLPIIAPDSSSYWNAYNFVPLGYPAVIHALYAATGSLKSIVVFQIAVFCASVLTLQAGISTLTRNTLLAGILAVLLFSYHGLAFQSLYLLSEELFIAALLLHIAAAAFAIARESKLALVMMALTAVLAVSLRPAGYFLFVAIVLLALIWKGRRRLVTLWAGVPLVLFTLVYAAIGLEARGVAAQTFTGLVVFPHVAYLYDGGGKIPAETERDLLQAIGPFRDEWERQLSWIERAEYERVNNSRMYYSVMPIIRAIRPVRNENDVAASLALHTVAKHPFEYAKLAARATAHGFYLFALAVARLDPVDLQKHYIDAEISRSRPRLEGLAGSKISFDPKVDHTKHFMLTSYPVPQIGSLGPWRYPLFAWAGLVMLVSFLRLYFESQANRSVLFVVYVSALLIGGYVLVGLSTAMIDRYAVPLDAILVVAMVVGCRIMSLRLPNERFESNGHVPSV